MIKSIVTLSLLISYLTFIGVGKANAATVDYCTFCASDKIGGKHVWKIGVKYVEIKDVLETYFRSEADCWEFERATCPASSKK